MAISFENVYNGSAEALAYIDDSNRLWISINTDTLLKIQMSGRNIDLDKIGSRHCFYVASNVKEAVVLSSVMLYLDFNGNLYGVGNATSNKEFAMSTMSGFNYTSLIATDVRSILKCYQDHFGQTTMFLKNDNTLWHCGSNSFGGGGRAIPATNGIPMALGQVQTNVNYSITCNYSCFAMLNTGELYHSGLNVYSYFGNTTNTITSANSYSGKYVAWTKSPYAGVTVKKLQNTSSATYILNEAGVLYACGYNNYGQLGNGNTTTLSVFTQIATDVKDFSATSNKLFIIKNDDTMWGAGDSYYGALYGYGVTTAQTANKTLVQLAEGVKSVYTTYNATYVLFLDGTLKGCGINQFGSMGPNATLSNTAANMPVIMDTNVEKLVKTNFANSTFIYTKTDGTHWVMGKSVNAFCNNPSITTATSSNPTQIMEPDFSMFLRTGSRESGFNYQKYNLETSQWETVDTPSISNGNKDMYTFSDAVNEFSKTNSNFDVCAKCVNYVPSKYESVLQKNIFMCSTYEYDASNVVGLAENDSYKLNVTVKTSNTKLVISKDNGVTWLTYFNDQWIPIDVTNLEEINEKGMTAATLNNVLLDKSFVKIKLGYLLEALTATSGAYPTGLSYNFDLKGSWQEVPKASYTYTFSEQYVILNIQIAGIVKVVCSY